MLPSMIRMQQFAKTMLPPTSQEIKCFDKLRKDFLLCKAERNHYKHIYRKECILSKKFKTKLIKSENRISSLTQEYEELKKKYLLMCQPQSTRPLRRKRKSWSKICCDHTKHQRICTYGDVVFNSIKNEIPQCTGATLELWLSGKRVNYMWKSKDFNGNGTKSDSQCTYHHHDHRYAAEAMSDKDADDINDIDYTEIFDMHGNWRKKHTLHIIHIMDSFRISHKAYHELRHAGKGHFPPLR